MRVYDLEFSDGKRCRMIDPEGDGLPPTNFHPGYLVGMKRIVAPPPEKLPWKRDAESDCWRLEAFELRKLAVGGFLLKWPGGELKGGKDDVSASVRRHWAEVIGMG